MRIGINSDFRDYYDHWFERFPVSDVLDRQSQGGISKPEQFALMQHLGLAVPEHGTLKDLIWESSADRFVIYENEYLHCGEGKRLAHRCELNPDLLRLYASEFIPTTVNFQEQSISTRLLGVGDRLWWLRYESSFDWRSNYGEVNIQVEHETMRRLDFAYAMNLNFDTLKSYPLFAIDFITPVGKSEKFAIDFNSAPGIKGTGMQDLLSAKEVVELISEFMVKNS